ncbi:MAG: UDP-glucose 4-epimerase GalE, partial [Saprospiraceae bacterium]
MGKILVTGGCGYIGSHTIVELIQLGYEVVCIDDLSNSDGSAIAGIESITGVKVKNTKISVGDSVALQTFFKEEGPIEAVIHFAAFKAVNESVTFPLKYYQNNLASLLVLIETMKSYHCNNLIFSSSCSVYGDAETLPVNEQTTLGVIQSPYARTKLIGEEILKDCCIADPEFKVIALRYFNPAGAHISNFIGESPTINASNLVPVITETAIGKRQEMSVFGDDYPTRDGTCIRDYIHV